MSTQRTSRVAIVTGASAGIGKAVAESLLAAGSRVVINGRREHALQAIENHWNTDGLRVVAVSGDASAPETIEALFTAAESRFHAPASVVVVNAGKGLGGSLCEVDLDEFEKILELNVLGASRLMQRAARAMTATPWGGSADPRDIVVLGSIAGRHISPFSAVYGATKFAVSGLAEGLRREIGPKGVRVTLLEPAIVLSEFQAGAGYTEEWHKNVSEQFGPLLLPEDIGALVQTVVDAPAHVHMSNIVIRPTRQSYP